MGSPGAAAPTPFAIEHDGLRIAGLDWGGDGEPLLLLHPNGFCAGLFDPVARRLAAGGGFRPVGVDLRGHGASGKPPPPEPYRYDLMAADVVAVLDHLRLDAVLAAGGSLGGGVAIQLDRLQPGRVRRMMLCEAIARPLAEIPTGTENPLVAVARRRRVIWPSRAEIEASYGSRPPLDALAPEALSAYLDCGTVARADGGVELACPPQVEAAIFGGVPSLRGVAEAWDHLAHLTAEAVVLAGRHSALPLAWIEAQAERAGAPFVAVDGGHFFLHEDTDRGVALIREHLGRG